MQVQDLLSQHPSLRYMTILVSSPPLRKACLSADCITADASERAQSLVDKGETNIRIIEINIPAATRMDVTMSREIAVLKGVPSFPIPAQFPIWEQKVTTAAGVQLMRAFSLKAVKTQLGVQISLAEERVWFVIDHIYGEMVIRKIKFD